MRPRHRRPLRRAGAATEIARRRRRRPRSLVGRTRADVTRRSSSPRPPALGAGRSPRPTTSPTPRWLDLGRRPRPRAVDGPVIEELRRVKDAGEVARIDARRARSPTRRSPRSRRCSTERPTEADVRDELEYRMRAPRRRRAELRHDRRQRPGERRPPAPRDRAAHDRRGRHRHHRRRRARRRLPLRHDPHRSWSASRRPSSVDVYDLRARGPAGRPRRRRAPASPPRDVDAACRDADRRRRLRRLVPPRHRPRGRPRHPRGPVRLARRRRPTCWRGTW